MKKDIKVYRRDGFFNFSATGDMPVLSEGTGGVKQAPIESSLDDTALLPLPPVKIIGPSGIKTVDPGTYSNPSFEVDFYSMSCDSLKEYMEKANTILSGATLSTDVYDPAADLAKKNYYLSKLAVMQSAYSTRCGANDIGMSVDPNINPQPLPPVVNPTTTTILPPGTAIPVIDVGGTGLTSGGAGGGGGSSQTTAATTAKKKKNWLLWIVCTGVVGIALYNTGKK